MLEHGSDDEGEAGGGMGGDDFRDAAAMKAGGIPEIEVRLGCGGGRDRGKAVAGHGKFFPKLLLKSGESGIRHGVEILPC